jgi:hypothetical protein
MSIKQGMLREGMLTLLLLLLLYLQIIHSSWIWVPVSIFGAI